MRMFYTLMLAAAVAVAIAVMATLPACNTVNNKEVPAYPVSLNLGTYALWNTYGVAGVGQWRLFNRAKQLPANFPYTAATYTGCGGVLLIMALDNASASYAPVAYDAACPVENSPQVSVTVNNESLEAVCPKCNSHYNVLLGMGGPLSGVALTNGYGLRLLRVHSTGNGGFVITN